MRLSDVKGEKALDIVADAMELAELIGGDERFTALAEDMKALNGDTEKGWKVMCKHLPAILRDEGYKRRIVSILAAAAGIDQEQYAKDGPILSDLAELFLTDSEALGFLAGSATSQT